MKDFFKNIQSVLIVVLVIVLIIKSCSGDTPEPKIVTQTKVEYVTVEKIVPKYVPKWKTRTETITKTDTFLSTIDTASILNNYYAKYYYNDEHDFDSLKINIFDTVSQNTIISRQIKYTLTYPKITTTNNIYINKKEVYIGLGGVGNLNQLNYIGGDILYKNKKNKIYSFGGGINQNLQPVVSAKIYWKIGK